MDILVSLVFITKFTVRDKTVAIKSSFKICNMSKDAPRDESVERLQRDI